MKCIKEDCCYYREHDFRSSYFICSLIFAGKAFLKANNMDCIIDREIQALKKYEKKLNQIKVNGGG